MHCRVRSFSDGLAWLKPGAYGATILAAGLVYRNRPPLSLFLQVFILKAVKVLCFAALSQVFILSGLARTQMYD